MLGALRGELTSPGRLVVVFQPHRYTRTKELASDLAASLQLADRVYFLPLYGAGERPIEGVDSRLVASLLPSVEKGILIAEGQLGRVFDDLTGDDIAVFLGAGDISASMRREIYRREVLGA